MKYFLKTVRDDLENDETEPTFLSTILKFFPKIGFFLKNARKLFLLKKPFLIVFKHLNRAPEILYKVLYLFTKDYDLPKQRKKTKKISKHFLMVLEHNEKVAIV